VLREQDERHIEAGPPTVVCRGERVMRAGRTGRDQPRAGPRPGIAEQELQLPDLVAGVPLRTEVVPLDEQRDRAAADVEFETVDRARIRAERDVGYRGELRRSPEQRDVRTRSGHAAT